MSLSSSSTDFSRPCPTNGYYDVFLSFRGNDTRYGFTSNLYHRLKDNKIHTFMDIKLTGYDINHLFEMIGMSKVAVVIYSENFASSAWCLKELKMILQRREEKKMLMVPIFYNINIHELQHLEGKTAEYLEKHILKYDKTIVRKWKDAITTLGEVSGLSYKITNGSYEYDFIKDVIVKTKEKLEEWEALESSSKRDNSGHAMEHDVFINFMGEDTRYSLVNHLFRALKTRKDLKTFMDDRDLSKDDNILDVIQQSKIAIIVFSKNYASSKWCLRELVKILQCRRNTTRQLEVLPIFYEIPPTDLINQAKGSKIADHLKEHELDEESDTLKSWKDAINDLGDMNGWRYSSAHGSKTKLADFIGALVEEISTILNRGSTAQLGKVLDCLEDTILIPQIKKESIGSSSQSFPQYPVSHTSPCEMGKLLNVEPAKLTFIAEPKKKSISTLVLSNKTDNKVAFQVKTTQPKKYDVDPNIGLVFPHSTREVIVTMHPQKTLPPNMKCNHTFVIESVKAKNGSSSRVNLYDMFIKESGNTIEECGLEVVYVAPDNAAQLSNGSTTQLRKVLDCLEDTSLIPPIKKESIGYPFSQSFPQYPASHTTSACETGKLLNVEPAKLTFIAETKKKSIATLVLSNNTDNKVAFQVKTTQPKKYDVDPNIGLVFPHSTSKVIVTMLPQKTLPPNMKCNHKFVIESVKAKNGSSSTVNLYDMFIKEPGNAIEECDLEVVYVAPDNAAQLSNGSMAQLGKLLDCLDDSIQIPQIKKEYIGSSSSQSFPQYSASHTTAGYRISISDYFKKLEETGELLNVKPAKLTFIAEPKKKSFATLVLSNKTDNDVAFQVKTTQPKKYDVHPNIGLVFPHSTCKVIVTMLPQKTLPPNMICNHSFVIESLKVKNGSASTVNLYDMFLEESDSIEECGLEVVYVTPDNAAQLSNKGLFQESERVISIDVHPTNSWILLSFCSGSARMWNYRSRAEEKSLTLTSTQESLAKFILKENKLLVVTGDAEGILHFFSYKRTSGYWKRSEERILGHTDCIQCLAVHSNSRVLLTTSDDKHIMRWSIENSCEWVETFKGHSQSVMQIAFNPKDSRSFASASLDGTIKVWKFNSPLAYFTINAHTKGLNCIEYFVGNDDKLYLLSGSNDYLIKIWDYDSKILVQTLKGHSDNVTAIFVHPKLPIIMTGSEDKTLRIWNKNTYQLELVWYCDFGRVWSIKFIGNTDEVALACDEGMVMIRIV